MIDYRGIVRERLLERTAVLNAKLERSITGDTQTAVAVLSGEVKALTDLLITFGEADCDLGCEILEAQCNWQDMKEEEQKARGMEPEDLLDVLDGKTGAE